MDTLIKQRAALVEDTYMWDATAFPGSADWRGYRDAWNKVTAWDLAHPGVTAEIARRRAETPAIRTDIGLAR